MSVGVCVCVYVCECVYMYVCECVCACGSYLKKWDQCLSTTSNRRLVKGQRLKSLQATLNKPTQQQNHLLCHVTLTRAKVNLGHLPLALVFPLADLAVLRGNWDLVAALLQVVCVQIPEDVGKGDLEGGHVGVGKFGRVSIVVQHGLETVGNLLKRRRGRGGYNVLTI